MAEIIQLKNRSTGEDQHPKTTTDAVSHNGTSLPSVLDAKQAKLVEGDNIALTPKADGTVEISASGGGGSSTPVVDNLNSTSTTSALSANQGKVLNSKFANKQDNLVSGTNIKTINGQSILGGGNITIEGGGSGSVDIINDLASDRTDAALAAAQGKALDAKITDLSSKVERLATTAYVDEELGTKADSLINLSSPDVTPVVNCENNKRYKFGVITSLELNKAPLFEDDSICELRFETIDTLPAITLGEGLIGLSEYDIAINSHVTMIVSGDIIICNSIGKEV